MKTTLMDMVKVTPPPKGIEVQKNSNAHNADSAQNETSWKETANTFTRALKKQEAVQSEPSSEKPAQNLSNQTAENPEKISTDTPVSKPSEQSRSEYAQKDEKIQEGDSSFVQGENEGEWEEDALASTQLVALSTDAPTTDPTKKHPSGEMPVTEKKETDVKISTLLSLLSAKTHLKVPKLEQYVSSMRNEGKSAQEILKTLNTVLEEVSDGETKPQLKDFILKVIPLQEKVTETADEEENAPAVQKTAVVKTPAVSGEKTPVTPETPAEEGEQKPLATAETDRVNKTAVTTTAQQKTQPMQIIDTPVTSEQKAEQTEQNTKPVQPLADQIKQISNSAVSTPKAGQAAVQTAKLSDVQKLSSETAEKLQSVTTQKPADALKSTVIPAQSDQAEKATTDQPKVDPEKVVLNEKNSTLSQLLTRMEQLTHTEQNAQVSTEETSNEALKLLKGLIERYRSIEKEAPVAQANRTVSQKTSAGTEQQIISEKSPEESLIRILSATTGVQPKKVESFFNSQFFSREELEGFIRFTRQEGIEEALKGSLTNAKDMFSVQESTLFSTLEFKSVKVKTSLIMDYIQKGFELKSFSKNMFSGGETILLKHKTKTITVEKMTVRFVRKPAASTENKTQNHTQNLSKDSFQKTGSPVQRFIQQSFKDGYESNHRKHTDLTHFQNRVNQPLQEKAEPVNLNAKTEKGPSETLLSESRTNIKSTLPAEQQEKDLKPLNKRDEGDDNTNQPMGKTLKGTAGNSEKIQAQTQIRNMEQVYQKIKDMTQLMARQQTRTELATIRLNPPELGKVSLEIVKEGNKISIVMLVETKEAQDILNKNSNILAARLVNGGFELQKVSVHMEKYEEQGENQANQNGQNDSQQQQTDEQTEQQDSEYAYEEGYSFQDLLKGGIEEHAN